MHVKGKIFKVVTNPSRGTIKVYDENGKLLMKKTNLSKEQVETIEESFLKFVTQKINDLYSKNALDKFDPMVT